MSLSCRRMKIITQVHWSDHFQSGDAGIVNQQTVGFGTIEADLQPLYLLHMAFWHTAIDGQICHETVSMAML